MDRVRKFIVQFIITLDIMDRVRKFMDKVWKFIIYCNPYKVHNLECDIPRQYPFNIIPDTYNVYRPVTLDNSAMQILSSSSCYPSVVKIVDNLGLDYSMVKIPESEARSTTVDLVYKFGQVSASIDYFSEKNVRNLKKLVEICTVLVEKTRPGQHLRTYQACEEIDTFDFKFVVIRDQLASLREEIIRENQKAFSRYNYTRIGKNLSFVVGVVLTLVIAGLQFSSLISPVVKVAISIALAFMGAFPYAAFGFLNSLGNALMKYLNKDIKVLTHIELSIRILCEHTRQLDRLEVNVNRMMECLETLHGTTAASPEYAFTPSYLYAAVRNLNEWLGWFEDLESIKKGMKKDILTLLS